ncbi:hypothetical protein [Ectobacillus ponti]|uniref:DUF4199 domain-containing protein n=1 Tax=Ectobacillus ponti TaxID=2961894 RepID=A0AA42BQY9_9BACI|nr:hypothetical protein [Ectobacillus ponti]MCP8970765.1 hypothetical protein [Ectobacillus ponti]
MSMLLLIILGLFVIGCGMFVLARQKESANPAGGETDMTMKSLYYYLVLFATLMMSIGGSVGVFMSAADYVSPRPYYESFEQYKLNTGERAVKEGGAVSQEELRQSYDAMVKAEIQRTKDGAINGIIKSLGWIIIPLPIFIYFQKQVRRKD